MTFGSIP